jgi:hypothetical protein
LPERNVTIRVDLSGQEKIIELQQQIANLYGQAARAVVVNVDAKGIDRAKSSMASAASTATQGFGKAAGAAKEIGNEVENVASKSLKNLQSAVGDVYSSFSKVAGMVAGMAVGGAIAGISYLGAAKSDLYVKEVYKAIDANKRLGFSSEDLKKKVGSMILEAPGWKTKGQATEELYNMMSYAGKYLGNGQKGLDNAENISKAFFENQEMMQKAGFENADDLVKQASRGTLRDEQKKALKNIGLSDADLANPQQIFKKLEGMGAKIDPIKLQADLDERPWIKAQNNISSLQTSIGKGIAPVMAQVTGYLANLIGMITEIPGAGALIGYVAIGIAVASALSLVVSLGTPLVTVFTLLKGLMLGHAVANAAVASTSVAVAGAEGVEAAANMGVAASAYAMAAGMWAAIAPILLIAVPLVALAAILYLVETKTGLFSNALKGLGQTQMAADLLNWFKDVGYWIGQGITAIDSLYKMAGGGQGLKMALDVATSGSMMLLKPTMMIADFLYKLWVNSGGLNKLIVNGVAIWKTASDIIGGLLATLKAVWSWLMNAIPGAKKEETRQSLQKELDKVSKGRRELTGDGMQDYVIQYAGNGQFEKKYADATTSKISDLSAVLGGSGLDKLEATKLGKLGAKYDQLPGFAEGIAKAVAQGLSGLGAILAQAVKDGLTGMFPDFSGLTKAIGDLLAWLEQNNPFKSGFGPFAGQVSTSGKPIATGTIKDNPGYGLKAGDTAEIYGDESKGYNIKGSNTQFAHWEDLRDVVSGLPDTPPKSSFGTPHASGGLILSRGLLIGDPGEPLIPANVANSSRLQEVLTRIAGGSGSISSQGNMSVALNGLHVDVHVDKLQTPQDLDKLVSLMSGPLGDKLMFALRDKLEKNQLRGIGYLQG